VTCVLIRLLEYRWSNLSQSTRSRSPCGLISLFLIPIPFFSLRFADLTGQWPQVATPWTTSLPPFFLLGEELIPRPLRISVGYFIFSSLSCTLADLFLQWCVSWLFYYSGTEVRGNAQNWAWMMRRRQDDTYDWRVAFSAHLLPHYFILYFILIHKAQIIICFCAGGRCHKHHTSGQ
jgi:hypothetical protein